MNSKRKADLQRKLSLAPVPTPPAGLADRIKNDIPDYLRPSAERQRVTRSLTFSLRIAASLLLVISSVIATIYLLEPEDQMKHIPVVDRQGPTQVFAERQSAAATDEVQVEITQTAAAAPAEPVQLALATPSTTAPAAPQVAASRRAEGDAAATSVAVGGTTGGVESVTIADLAPPPAPPPAAAPVAPPAEIAEPQRVTVTAEAPQIEERSAATGSRMKTQSFVAEAHAADLELGPKSSVFGISVDASVFHKLKETLENNQRPSAAAVNLEAIVNYFAGATPRPPRRGVELEVEGSPSPVGGIGRTGFLRFTIDTAATATNTPVAADAKLDVDFNGKIVEAALPVGDSAMTGIEAALLQNLSVTGLYEVTLKPNIRPTDRVATVTLTYTNVIDGKRRTIERSSYVRDFTRTWTRASRRHRLASLGAVWGQSLKVSAPAAPEVARRAEELATQNPGDERAQELATAAANSSKLTNSSGF